MREKPCVRCRRRWGFLRRSADRKGENKTDRLRGPEGKIWTINLISSRVQTLINREIIINKGIFTSREITVSREIIMDYAAGRKTNEANE